MNANARRLDALERTADDRTRAALLRMPLRERVYAVAALAPLDAAHFWSGLTDEDRRQLDAEYPANVRGWLNSLTFLQAAELAAGRWPADAMPPADVAAWVNGADPAGEVA